MRIFYDGFIYDFQPYGGINRYFNEIIARLPAGDEPVVSTFLGAREFWPEHPCRSVLRSRPFARVPALAALGRGWLSLRTALARADLFHPTYYHLLTPGVVRRRPLVVTVHDMIHEIFPEQIDRDGAVRAAKRASIERADAILCNSEHTRRDLIERFPSAVGRSYVTPLASSMTVDVALARAEPGLDRPYFLYVGGREGYKNFAPLLAAWRRFSVRHSEIQLRVVGSPWLPAERRELTEACLERSVVHEGRAGDARLAALYHRSLALVYPSLYEGFGIPLLEAMRCGTAVVCARSSSLPEVGGDAPFYFDPANAEDLCAQLEAVATSSSVRAAHVARGAERADVFSWDRTAILTLEVYRKLTPTA